MNSRPSAVQFAQWSLYLAYATSAIMVLALILNVAGTSLGAIIWLAFVTSGAGAFMGWAARRDFKIHPDEPNIMQMARRGFRTNAIAFGCLIVMFIVVLIIQGVTGQQNVPVSFNSSFII